MRAIYGIIPNLYIQIYKNQKMSKYQKGATFERLLVRKFWDVGFASLRAAGSGSAPLPLPDIIAIKDRRILAIECKTSAKDQFYLSKHNIEKLSSFSKLAGAEAYVAVKFNTKKPMFIPLDLVTNRKISRNSTSLNFETLVGIQKTLEFDSE